jgi:hypothetical protein
MKRPRVPAATPSVLAPELWQGPLAWSGPEARAVANYSRYFPEDAVFVRAEAVITRVQQTAPLAPCVIGKRRSRHSSTSSTPSRRRCICQASTVNAGRSSGSAPGAAVHGHSWLARRFQERSLAKRQFNAFRSSGSSFRAFFRPTVELGSTCHSRSLKL